MFNKYKIRCYLYVYKANAFKWVKNNFKITDYSDLLTIHIKIKTMKKFQIVLTNINRIAAFKIFRLIQITSSVSSLEMSFLRYILKRSIYKLLKITKPFKKKRMMCYFLYIQNRVIWTRKLFKSNLKFRNFSRFN